MATSATRAASDFAALTPSTILANARQMAPAIAARSQEIEALRRLPANLVEDLRAAGLFRMARSRAKGGPEMTLPQQLEVIEIIAAADPSAGWCVKIGVDSGIIAELLPPAASARLLPDPDIVTAGQFTTGHGRLERVEGGYRMTGRFPFGSGVTHADVVMSGGMVTQGGEPLTGGHGMAEARLAFCRADQLEIEDSWHTHGLRGSGSNHYRADGVFIPEDQAMRIEPALFAGRAPLYSSGFNWVATMAAVSLGTARRALEEAKALLGTRKAGMPPRPMADMAHARDAIAKAETAHCAAHAFLFAAAGQFWAELESGTPSTETKGRLALANVNSFRMAADVTRAMFDLIGAHAIFQGTILERLARDALTLNQHMIVSQPAVETYGAMILGQPHPSPLY